MRSIKPFGGTSPTPTMAVALRSHLDIGPTIVHSLPHPIIADLYPSISLCSSVIECIKRSEAYLCFRFGLSFLSGFENSLPFFKFPYPRVVSFHLFTKNGVFDRASLLVVLKTCDAVQSFEVKPSSPSHAYAIHYERWLYVNLKYKNAISSCLSVGSPVDRVAHPTPVQPLYSYQFYSRFAANKYCVLYRRQICR